MSTKKESEAKARAYDHYRWAERYNRQGEDQKAKAHMRRAVHYGKAAFGTGPDTGAAPMQTAGAEPMQTDDHNVNVIFVLSPLNAYAVERIRAAIRMSIANQQRVEVYMQAFSKPEWKGLFTAPNLLPMNFNQYSSEDPFSLVSIVQDFQTEKLVTFYIFPTQTTKNDAFNKKCTSTLSDLMTKNASAAVKIDQWMNAAIVSWGIRNTKDEKGDDIVADLTFQEVINEPAKYFEKKWAPAPVFDPFCVHWAVNNELRTRAEWPIKAHPTKVGTAIHEGMQVPDFTETMHHARGDTNCFYVLWDMCQLRTSNEEELKKKVEEDAVNYINAIWESFKSNGTRSSIRRKIMNMLIVQDYYDYDNKMSVWYALYMFQVMGKIELLSITRPVANRNVMVEMRKHGDAFKYSGNQKLKPAPAATKEDKWPTAPVITKDSFDAFVATIPNYDGPTFKDYQVAINPLSDEARAASSKEAEEITNMWRAWLFRFYATRKDLEPVGGYTCTNGGYPNRHGMNPVVHTLMEDWFKEPEPQMPKRLKT
jgi:hypothetical protein